MHGYLDGTVRNEALQVSYQAAEEVPILIGGGLDYAYTLLQTLPIGTPEEPHLFHFHNQYMQTLVQSGVIGLLLWLSLLGSMLWVAHRQHRSVLIVVVSPWILSLIHIYLIWREINAPSLHDPNEILRQPLNDRTTQEDDDPDNPLPKLKVEEDHDLIDDIIWEE